jgi:hypothetical protein
MKFKLNDFLVIVKIIINNILIFRNISSEKFVLVTASDEKHFIYLENLIRNHIRYYKKKYFEKLIIFDIGLNDKQISKISTINSVELRKFSFEEYQDYYKLRLPEHGNKIGGFAWKPEMISLIKNEKKEKIIWLDSACRFNWKIIFFLLLVIENGFASFNSTGVIEKWTHQNVLKDLSIETEKNILNSPNLLAGVVGFNFKKKEATDLLNAWNSLASKKELIFPKNSNSSNHRHDQSLLSICYWKSSDRKLPSNHQLFGITIQNWPNKILFFFDGKGIIIEKLMKKYYFQSTTTNNRCKVIILFDSESIKKIPLRLILTKRVLVFISSTNQYKIYKRNLLKKQFIKVYIDKTCTEIQNIQGELINYEYHEIDKIIENEYKINVNARK